MAEVLVLKINFMKYLKINSKKFYSFKNGVKISEENLQKWLDEILMGGAKDFKEDLKLRQNIVHISSGDSIVIVSFYRLKKKSNKFYLNIWIATSEGYSHCEIEKFKLYESKD